jgi:hypothetical protein
MHQIGESRNAWGSVNDLGMMQLLGVFPEPELGPRSWRLGPVDRG